MIGRGTTLKYWSNDMKSGVSRFDCCYYCETKYLKDNMIGLNSSRVYGVSVKSSIFNYEKMQYHACVRCFNHLVLETGHDKLEQYKRYLNIKKIGEKNDKNMENGNKHR